MEVTDLTNLASAQLGTKIVFATDEWFAAAENMISDVDPVFHTDLYTPFGKWMDGWETRRRRTEGHDWCIVQLGIPGRIRAIEVDTMFFTGNYSPKVSIYGAHLEGDVCKTSDRLLDLRAKSVAPRAELGRMGLCATEEEFSTVKTLQSDSWNVLVPLTPLTAGYAGTSKTTFTFPESVDGEGEVFSHLRINMGPDGGIARIRVYGEVVVPDSAFAAAVSTPSSTAVSTSSHHLGPAVDLLAVQHGGQALAWSNKHYGHPRNMIAPGRGTCMGDGWETARQPKRPAVYQKGADGLMVLPGYDWALFKLGVRGVISALEVDTNFYTGNFPESCLIEGCVLGREVGAQHLQTEEQQAQATGEWKVLLPRTRLGPGAQHYFTLAENHLNNVGSLTHLKITIYPDGGVMRLRAMGHKNPENNSRL